MVAWFGMSWPLGALFPARESSWPFGIWHLPFYETPCSWQLDAVLTAQGSPDMRREGDSMNLGPNRGVFNCRSPPGGLMGGDVELRFTV